MKRLEGVNIEWADMVETLVELMPLKFKSNDKIFEMEDFYWFDEYEWENVVRRNGFMSNQINKEINKGGQSIEFRSVDGVFLTVCTDADEIQYENDYNIMPANIKGIVKLAQGSYLVSIDGEVSVGSDWIDFYPTEAHGKAV